MLEVATVMVFKSAEHELKLESLYKGEEIIWGFDFLPQNRILFSERNGKLRIYDPIKNVVTDISGVPQVVAESQGGLLDVVLHPQFEKNQLVYFTYSVKLADGYTTRVARGQLQGSELKNVQVLFTAAPGGDSSMHYGARIAFDGQGHIFVSIGERNERDQAQDLNSHHGKVIRLNEDGTLPKDNPYIGESKVRPEIYSYGHRNPQGLFFDSTTKKLFLSEHGPRGGDEINLIKAKANYGWPRYTHGREYWGPKIGDGPTATGIEGPIKYYVPSIAPSSLTQYRGQKIKGWNGDWFLGALKLKHLNRVVIQNDTAIREERLLEKWGKRIRHVRMGPDELLYLSTDDGILARISPK